MGNRCLKSVNGEDAERLRSEFRGFTLFVTRDEWAAEKLRGIATLSLARVLEWLVLPLK